MFLSKPCSVATLSFLCALVPIFSTNAYYYEEHKLISQNALELAIKHKMIEIDSDQIRKAIGSKFICEDVMEREPEICMTLADLPAIAGDHAGSPMLVQWKWLNDTRSAPVFFGVSDYLASTRIIFDEGCISSETTKSKIPAREDFIEVVHRNPDATTFGETNEINSHDNNYVRSAAHNCNHFRDVEGFSETDSLSAVTDSYQTEISKPFESNSRKRFKPKLEAGAWYAQLHATALELAARKGDQNLAAAWLFETFALHFIQDGAAAGHIVTPNHGGITVLSTKAIHDHYSQRGIPVTLESACHALNNNFQMLKQDLKQLSKSCSSTGGITKIFGDRLLEETAEISPTKDLAIFLTTISLAEFGESFRRKQPLISVDESKSDYSDPHWTFQGQSNDKLAKTLFSWWESGGSANATTSPMAEAAEKHLERGRLQAIKLWPQAL